LVLRAYDIFFQLHLILVLHHIQGSSWS
jgi:hypothetical protein